MTKVKPEKIIVLCDSFEQAEFEFGCFIEFLNAQYEPIRNIIDSALIVTTDEDIQFKFLGRRWLRFIEDKLDMNHTEIMDLDEFVEMTYGGD